MGSSLQDQLLNAGMINKKKAKKISAQQRMKARKNRKTHVETVNEVAQAVHEKNEAERKKSQALNQQRQKDNEAKAIKAQIQQIIKMNSIDKESDKPSVAYNFTHFNTIKTITVSEENQKLISNGRIAIATINESYYLIPAEAAEKINQRDQQSIVLLNDKHINDNATKDDDPYADYQVPDDLMW